MTMKSARLYAAGLLCAANLASAQTSAEGTIRGFVRDQQAGVLPGVTIEATSASIGARIVAVTEGDGSYRLLGLAPGDYTVRAELAGFSQYVRSGVVVRAGLNLGLDIQLTIGALQETVN